MCLSASARCAAAYASLSAPHRLFVRPADNANRAWVLVRVSEQIQRFPCDDESAAVIHRALPHVPRIDMTAEDHDLVRFLGAATSANRVAARNIGERLRIHPPRRTTTFSPRLTMRWIIIASSA